MPKDDLVAPYTKKHPRGRTIPTRRTAHVSTTTPRRPVSARMETAPPLSMPPEQLLNLKELCRFLGMGKTTVVTLIHQHGLPVYTIKGINRFDPREVWQWVQVWRKQQSL